MSTSRSPKKQRQHCLQTMCCPRTEICSAARAHASERAFSQHELSGNSRDALTERCISSPRRSDEHLVIHPGQTRELGAANCSEVGLSREILLSQAFPQGDLAHINLYALRAGLKPPSCNATTFCRMSVQVVLAVSHLGCPQHHGT